MGKGSNQGEETKTYSWKEIKSHKYWIVINDKIYNIENFSKKHPGGEQIILNHATQDATVFYFIFFLNL
jgi:cytochrome b involved in lipid metabolism